MLQFTTVKGAITIKSAVYSTDRYVCRTRCTVLLGEGQSGVPGKKSFNQILTFLSAFAQLRKATISFIMSVCLCARNNVSVTG